MGFIIALAGKGGTGKTTIAALLVRVLNEQNKGSILAIDADPNSNLAEFLGIKVNKSIGDILDDIARNPDMVPKSVSKDAFIEYEVQKALEETEDFTVLTMGKPEGPGCYCYVNNVLRNIMSKLIDDFHYIIIDNEAGLEHLSRRTTRCADCLIVVSCPTEADLRAAKRIFALAKDLKIKIRRKTLIVNRVDTTFDEGDFRKIEGVDYLGCIPEDKEILELSRRTSSLVSLSNNALSLEKLRQIAEKLWQWN
ncbi:MAG: AAA family ATPase [Candidatus Omnitrophica bacterium]|nr:AAA family ATPase [Candidatus Omnitrophota bacterium]MCM8770638.1 AAA family ATPase [Candidatus Omnitrophota bacterium]